MTTENQSQLPDKKRLEEIRQQQVWRRQHADKFKMNALHAACSDIDYLRSLLQQPTTSERCEQGQFCYAEGDEGARYCGAPARMHCDAWGDAAFGSSPAGQRHLVECMRDAHLIHHAFVSEVPATGADEGDQRDELQGTLIESVVDYNDGPRVIIRCKDFHHAQRLQAQLTERRNATPPANVAEGEAR